MMVTLKIFGTMRVKTGVGELSLKAGRIETMLPTVIENSKLSSKVKVKDLRECIVMKNGIQCDMKTEARDGDTVVLLSPSGGG